VVIVYLLIIGSCGTEIVIPGGAGGGSDGCVAGFRNVAPAADVAPYLLFIRLIIRIFHLVFSAETIFLSHNKSANSVFQPVYQHNRTGP
jgi:hypothetical protein